MSTLFAPTRQAALARLDAVDPQAYARSRNHLDGAVTRLSPYLTHGLITLPEAYHAIHARTPLDPQGKLVFEFGWRDYHHHVWAHLGDGIHRALHPGLHDDPVYAAQVPDDVRHATTGIPAIDRAVQTLYATGYLHNHARMWLASYLVHIRKVHWHAGARWMVAHLLDGDLASNHLSWQWVAGTGSTKPYLFNAENVARYSPAPWHSPGTVIDTTYETLDTLARRTQRAAPRAPAQPSLFVGTEAPEILTTPPAHHGFVAPDAGAVAGQDVWLVHAWSMGQRPDGVPPGAICIAVLVAEFHQHNPWSALRWSFVGQRMHELASGLWFGSTAALCDALASARSVHVVDDLHLGSLPGRLQSSLQNRALCVHPKPVLFEPVDRLCASFSAWWKRTRIAAHSAHEPGA